MSLHLKLKARWALERAERDGLIRWTGRWKNGEKVYKVTDAGRAWANEARERGDDESS